MPPKKKQAVTTPQVEAKQQQQAITPKSRSQRKRERQRRRQAQSTPRVLFEKPAPSPKSSPDESSSDEEEIESPRERDVRRRRAAPRRTGHARTLDKFYGHDYDELRNWLYQVEAVADADGWSRRERLHNARVVLSGRARSEVVAFERQLQRRDKRVTWEALTAFLKRKFGPADPQVYYTEKLIECRQGLREDVDTFTTRFRNLVFELLEVDPAALSEPMQVQHFVNGLRQEYRDELVRGRPRDLEEAEVLARTGERIWRLRSKTNSECLAIETRTSDAPRRHESKTSKRDASPRRKSLTDVLATLAEKQTELIEVIKGQHKEMMDKMEQNTRLLTEVKKSSGPRCDHCKMRGHTKDQCFKLHPPNRDKSTTGRQTEQAKVNAVTAGERPAKTPTGVTVGGVEPSRILFDSGAEVSTLSSQFVEDIGGVTLNDEFPILTVANGGSMKARGTVILPVEIGDLTFDCRFVVSDELALPVIFGQDFLHNSGASMDFREGTITVRKEDDEQRVRLMSLMSEADGVETTAFDGAHRVCAITASAYSPFSLPAAQFPVRPEDKDLTTADEVQPQTDRTPPKETDEEDVELTAEVLALHRVESSQKSILFPVNEDLADCDQKQLMCVLEAHIGAFATGLEEHGRLKGVTHSIDTGDAKPTNQPPRRLAPPLMEEARRQIDIMLQHGIIQESTSPWASPILFRDKKDKTRRFCVDFRDLNEITRKDRIEDCFDILGGNLYFTSLDLQAGYWQILMAPGDIAKTAFICPLGLYEFLVMPFGLCNAPSTFQRAMDTVLAGVKWKTCLVYIDDILVFGRTFDEHLERLGDVLSRIEKSGLKLKPSKCSFAQTEVYYLGHIISAKGINVDPEKVKAVKSLLPPTSKMVLRSFLGLASYYRRFISDFADVAQPLTRLLRDDARFEWGSAQVKSFATLKERLTTAPILAYPDWDATFLLQTDASNDAIAAVLSQVGTDGLERVISYASRVLQDRERRYDTREKELLAVVYGCETFRHYLVVSSFIIITDHANLRWLMSSTKMSGRLAHWVLQLQDFVFEVRHKPGRANKNADALSRLPTATVNAIRAVRVPSFDELRENQLLDPVLHAVIRFLAAGSPDPAPPEVQEVFRDRGTLTLEGASGVLCFTSQNGKQGKFTVPYLAPVDRFDVIAAAHNLPISGHFGREKTTDRVRRQYYWKGMRQDIKDFVQACHRCQIRKRLQPVRAGKLQLFSASQPFETVGIDIAGPFPVSERGNRYVVAMGDRFTRWVEITPVAVIDAITVADVFVDKIILRHGCPKELLSDRGSQFTSLLLRRLADRLGIKKIFTTAYHPQCNGQVERFNRTLKAAITTYVNDDHTD